MKTITIDISECIYYAIPFICIYYIMYRITKGIIIKNLNIDKDIFYKIGIQIISIGTTIIFHAFFIKTINFIFQYNFIFKL